MKILMVNRVLYRRSASESVMLCLADTLQRMGHHVAFFAQDHPANPILPDAYVISHRPRAACRPPGGSSATRAPRSACATALPPTALTWPWCGR